ncbi:hypothetical protein WR25_23107 [Diploscapter pachys]|uniref:C2H2-type domain-containing protein n=1 Tax=Diploscapter pachys TaxID=2018661 RepID=A0A2A2LQP2_9BILA|nr:hypothetical protein WR25_23107 [Diploscapter pachys]
MIFVLDATKEEELERMLEAVKNKRTDIAREKPQTTTIPRMEPASMLNVIDMQLAQSDEMPSTSSAYNQEQVEFTLQSLLKTEFQPTEDENEDGGGKMNGECDNEDPSTAAASQQPHVNVSSLFGDTFGLAKEIQAAKQFDERTMDYAHNHASVSIKRDSHSLDPLIIEEMINDGRLKFCQMCKKHFSICGGQDLMKHVAIHMKEVCHQSRYACSLCDYQGSQYNHVRAHVQSKHNQKLTSELFFDNIVNWDIDNVITVSKLCFDSGEYLLDQMPRKWQKKYSNLAKMSSEQRENPINQTAATRPEISYITRILEEIERIKQFLIQCDLMDEEYAVIFEDYEGVLEYVKQQVETDRMTSSDLFRRFLSCSQFIIRILRIYPSCTSERLRNLVKLTLEKLIGYADNHISEEGDLRTNEEIASYVQQQYEIAILEDVDMADSHQTHIVRQLLINLASAWQTIEPNSPLGNSLGKIAAKLESSGDEANGW